MTVYAGDIAAQTIALAAAVEAVDLMTATNAEMEALARAAQELAQAASDRLATLDADMATEGSGGLANVVSGADALASAATLKGTLADYEQAIVLFAVQGYAGRLHVNIREAQKLR